MEIHYPQKDFEKRMFSDDAPSAEYLITDKIKRTDLPKDPSVKIRE